MSMSQEEIEALMNGLDFEDESKEEAPSSEEPVAEVENKSEEPAAENMQMSEDEINNLISETQEIVDSKEETPQEESVDDILKGIDETLPSSDFESSQSEVNDNIEDVLNEIEEMDNPSIEEDVSELSVPKIEEIEEEVAKQAPVQEEKPTALEEVEELSLPDEPVEKESAEESIDDILASVEEPVSEPAAAPSASYEERASNDLDSKIDSGVFPLPADKDTKVVNQLSQVANDSEEKATKIFDVLSNILDYNNEIQNDVQELSTFSEKQTAMLSSLNQKFPNIDAFKENLEQAEKMASFISDINEKLNNGNMEIFQAMELMQYHDINRQKIERVMSVIRKLTVYLNNLFEDENDYQEIAVAKHIHGDSSTGDLMAEDDLDALISEFNK